MPMTVEAVVAYFGTVLAGCAVVSIADSFAAGEIATRLRIANAAAIVTQDVIGRGRKLLPLYARVVEAKSPCAVVVPASQSAGLQVRVHGTLPFCKASVIPNDVVDVACLCMRARTAAVGHGRHNFMDVRVGAFTCVTGEAEAGGHGMVRLS
jgi:hypothetical protein